MSPRTTATSLPLTELTPGHPAVVAELEGGRHFRTWLISMGIRVGVVIQVAQSAGRHGPVRVVSGSTRLAIGRGMAERIRVSPLNEKKPEESPEA
ncbi:ferrous iron transport protein A [bacterium]|nr:ferrous iron transport protein A [bacterium]